MRTSEPPEPSSSFPLWTWPEPPESCADAIDFGLTGGAFIDLQSGVDSAWTFKNNHNSNFSVKAISSLEQVFPRTRHYTHPNLRRPVKRNTKAVINYFQANFEDAYIPQTVFEECLNETLAEQESQLHYDPFYGNATTLLASKFTPDSHYLAFPAGEVGNTLNISMLGKVHGESSSAFQLRPSTEPVTKFTTPIRQVVASKSNEDAEIIGVRTISGVTFLTFKEKKQHDPPGSCKTIGSFSLPTEPMHLAINPYWVGEAAVVGDKGYLSIWDVNSPKSQRVVMDVKADEDVRFADKWRSCEWGTHPRSLVIGSATDIKLLDLRDSSSPSLLYTPSNEKVYALQRGSNHEMQSFFSTTTRVGIIDHRFGSRPLLQWRHNQREPPSQLQVFVSPKATENKTCILGWNRFESEVNMYTYERSPTYGTFSSAGYPVSLESISSHPDYLSDELVHPMEFKPNKVGRDERDYQRHPPLAGLACFPYWSDTSLSDENDSSSRLFSLFQYIENGSIYSQVYRFGSGMGPSSYIDDEGFFVPGASQGDGMYTQDDEEVTTLIARSKSQWPSSVLEMEKQADHVDLSPLDLKRCTKVNMRSVMQYLASTFHDETDSSSALIKEEKSTSTTSSRSPSEFNDYLSSLKSPASVYDMVQNKDGGQPIENVQEIVKCVTKSLHLKLDWRGIRNTVLYPWDSNANQILELNNKQDIRVLLKSEFELNTEGHGNDEESLLLFETLEEKSIFGPQTGDKAIEQMTEALYLSSLVHIPVQKVSLPSQQDDSLDLELQDELDEFTPRKPRAPEPPLHEMRYVCPQGSVELDVGTKALLQEWSIGDAPPEMDHGIEEYMDMRVKSQSRRTFLKNVPATPLTFKGSRPLITKSISQPDSEAGRNLYFSPLSHFRRNDLTTPAVSRSQPQAATPQWRTPHIRASQPSQSTAQTPRTILKSIVKRKLDHISQSQATPSVSTPPALSKTQSWVPVSTESPPPIHEIPSTPQFTASQPVAGSTNVRKSKKKKPRMSGF
ncbi:hypothetical protein K493DRAFT_341476 [Basidiobolus meristosporus CBS 931.73]|uniref:RRN6 beta-propeller domain-containing protein n=1 Tax=Basidiobolus meristosporus CBS 931.73 TaxID=1314790 RepID=A0A1Y1XPU6_9FUNG|nr:hypothetical protein K493DRAFT_341476 [Basidiobolus meristosporus CBS 931.73]|eukprot:ORX87536.1 hypothetical protein K493DRAFT_341476 [Basidiobolus meristosporus CBS 931.73]